MQLVVGRIAKAHGIGGEVSVDVRTDDPDHRFAVGSALDTDPVERGPLTVEGSRWHAGRLLVRFDGIADRNAAEALRGTVLVVDSDSSLPAGDDDDFWDHDLIGLSAVLPDGTIVGPIVDVLHPLGSDTLVIAREGADEALVPFVREFVPSVDRAGGRIVIDPPEGLLDL